MGMLRVMSSKGDQTVLWDQSQVEARDPEALDAVREAERVFEEQRKQGATAFRVAPDTPVKKLERFEPEAEQIIMVPRVQGG